MTPDQRRFLDAARVARLATADAAGVPHLVPVCFALAPDAVRLYVTIDGKPKSGDVRGLKRLRNIAANPAVAVLVDHYEEDWGQLGWVMVRGRADILEGGDEHAAAQALLRTKYPQYRAMRIETLPVIAVTPERVSSWGRLG